MKRSFTSKIIVTFVALSVCLSCVQIQAFAQVNQPQQKLIADSSEAKGANDASDANSTTSVNPTNAEVLKELQQMRARIAELEAQLKAQQGGAPAGVTATVTNVQPATAVSSSLSKPIPIPQPSTEQAAKPAQNPEPSVPFAFADWTWLNGTAREKDAVWDSKFFTPEIRFDANYISSFNHPQDDSIGGSTETFRSNEVQIEQISFGGDFHWQDVHARILTMGRDVRCDHAT